MGSKPGDDRLEAVLRHIRAGDELVAGERPAEALGAFKAALALRPEDPKIHNKVGLAYRLLGESAAAIASYTRAALLDPASVVAHFNLGVLYTNQGDFEQAVVSYQKVLDFSPRNVDALRHLADAFAELGRIEEARAATRKILAIVPDDPKAHYRLARLVEGTLPDDEIQSLEAAYAQSQPGGADRMNLAFGLGEALERRHRYKEAMGFLGEGNAIRGADAGYDLESDRRAFAHIKATFDAGLFSRLRGSGCRDPAPIFIVGMPRSGTTLVEQILASHPRVHGAGELDAMSRLASGFDAHAAPPEAFAGFGRQYIAAIRQIAPKSPFVTDKMPHNFLHIGLIHLALPEAGIIHLRRDPADTCLSIFKAQFARGHFYACKLADLGHYYNLYRDLMAHWHATLPGAIYDIDYEDLVQNQEQATRALLEHCGLEWDDACLNFHQTRRKVKTASFGQVHRPIYATSIGLARRYGETLAPLLEALDEDPPQRP